MKNAWLLFKGDLKRMKGNVVTVIVLLGIVLLPSIFSWYNMIACWNVFDNTGNLSVAVANVDEGYESDLMPIEINVGDKVVSALRANDQINWVITSEEDAVDGAKSGKYYAAVVIPESFSRDMMTFYSDEVEHANIVYYSNEKKNAIAPRVTDQGADTVSAQVNTVFSETLADAALSIAKQMLNYSDENDMTGEVAKLSTHVDSLSQEMSRAASVVRSYSDLMGASQQLVSSSGDLLGQAKSSAEDVSEQVGDAKESANDIVSALSSATSALSAAVDASASTFDAVQTSVDSAFDSSSETAQSTLSSLRSSADGVRKNATNYQEIAEKLVELKQKASDETVQTTLQGMADQMNSVADLMNKLADNMDDGASDLEKSLYGDPDNPDATSIEQRRQELKNQIANAKAQVEEAKTDYNENLKPQLDTLSESISDLSEKASSSATLISDASGSLIGAADSASSKMSDAQSKLNAAADKMDESAGKLSTLSANLNEALSTGDAEMIRDVLAGDTSSLASALSAPVAVERHALYPSENFGSAMAPLYTSIALWIGALLIMVTLTVTPSQRILRELDNPKLPQIFLGRFGSVAVLSIMQSVTLCMGNMFFLGVQVVEPVLYVLCFVVSGLAFSFIIYTMVASFANLGKALAVILLILQVAGGGGSFPLIILPQFFQDVSMWLPATHAVNAMRAAMFGVYANDFWIEIGILLLFTVPFILLGFVLRNPTMKLVEWFVGKVEESKLI